MGSAWTTLALLAVLVVINAVLAGSEIALISLREGQLTQLERRGGRRAAALVTLARDPNRFLAAVQIGITLSGFLASATAAITLAEPLAPRLTWLGGAAEGVAVAGVTAVLTFVTLVVGELAPKRLAMQAALPWALTVARPLSALAALSRPAIWALGAATNVTVRMLGGDPKPRSADLSAAELHEIVRTHRGLTAEQQAIITGALEIHDRPLRRVLVPRGAVFLLDAATPIPEARQRLAASGHARAPVSTTQDLDDVIGVVALRDLVQDEAQADQRPGSDSSVRSLADVVTAPLVLPESVRVTDALRIFRDERQQFAIVVDEHGGVDGIVTLEDLLEEVVGEIYDETDRDVAGATRLPDGSHTVPGTFPVHDLADIGVELTDPPQGDYATVAGLILARLGRIPKAAGDAVQVGDWVFEVTEIRGPAITQVMIRQR